MQPLAALRIARPLDSTRAPFAGDRAASISPLLQGLLPIGAMVLFTTAAANQSSKVAAAPERRRKLTGYVMTDSSIKTAVDYWLSNGVAAEAMYGHISTWETGGVTDMLELFCAYQCYVHAENSAAGSFNDDIGAWDTSSVTDMNRLFRHASSFNQPLHNWQVDKVTDMRGMFAGATSFNQPLGGWRFDKRHGYGRDVRQRICL